MTKENNKTTIDVEPTWEDIVRMYGMQGHKVGDEGVLESLYQMAKICDTIRAAQKEKKIFVSLPNGQAFTFDSEKELVEYFKNG